jgi:hypothetical protein
MFLKNEKLLEIFRNVAYDYALSGGRGRRRECQRGPLGAGDENGETKAG